MMPERKLEYRKENQIKEICLELVNISLLFTTQQALKCN